MATEDRISRLEGAYEQVDTRLGDTNARLNDISSAMNSRFNQITDEMNSRFNEINQRITQLQTEMNRRFTEITGEMNRRLDQVDRRFNTMYIVFFGGWATLLAAIIGMNLV